MTIYVVVTGDRVWDDVDTMIEPLSSYVGQDVVLIEGECQGADLMARAIGEELGFIVEHRPARWRDENGSFRKWAGPERNQLMLDEFPQISVCHAFHNDIFSSKGTKDMLKRVISKNITRTLWATPKTSVQGFHGKHKYLSNFTAVPVTLDGETYTSVEHAYQAAKTLDLTQRADIKKQKLAKDVKRFGKTVDKRKDWDDVKVEIMHNLLREKFSQDLFNDALLSTRNAELVEANYWNDTFWGVYNGKGQNVLGRLLMDVREEVRSARH